MLNWVNVLHHRVGRWAVRVRRAEFDSRELRRPAFSLTFNSLAVMVTATGLVGVIVMLVWARQIVPADREARFALDSDDAVVVSRTKWIAFRPRDVDPLLGVIFYPGGKADPAAYAPLLRELAAQGYLVVVTPMPLNLALLAPGRAQQVMPRFPEVRRWVIAGHRLGGVAAADFARRHPEKVAGVMLWAAFPAQFTDLSQASLPVPSIFGTADPLITSPMIAETRRRLPAATRFVAVDGGDQWDFGNFAQGKTAAMASRYAQHQAVLKAATEFLASLAHGQSAAAERAGG